MIKKRSEQFYYSQLALSTYQTCQLKFRRRYLEKLYWPRVDNEMIRQGTDLHAACSRYYSTGIIPTCDERLDRLIEKVIDFRPLTGNGLFLPEQEIRLNGEHKLVAKYDLIYKDKKTFIYDWKTDRRKPTMVYYIKSLQTIVYRYLIVKAGSTILGGKIDPADVTMIYFNPGYPHEPVILDYNERQYVKDENIITGIIEEIKNKQLEDFLPTANDKVCSYCEYSPICHGVSPAEDDEYIDEDLALDWDDIEEIII